MATFEVFIGLEIHVQLLTESKMFCACKTSFGDAPNSHVCPVCLGFPGMLPVPNMQALEYAYTLANALSCTLAPEMHFDRKNYYYPDLPKNYQITQFYHPCGTDGTFEFLLEGEKKSIAVKEAHLEEDAGKLLHTSDVSLCDYNRSGTPLMEVVTQPHIRSPHEAEQLLKQFRQLVRYLGVCDGNMEEGSMRCDANISLNHAGQGLGSKVEIKNVNSFRFVRMALEYEIGRQTELLKAQQSVVQETRLWNENRDITESMRMKEEANDYRYIPEPDIIPHILPNTFFDTIAQKSIELPLEKRTRFETQYNLSGHALDYFTEEKYMADFFEKTTVLGGDPVLIQSWMPSDVQKQLNTHACTLEHSPLTPERFARMLVLLQEGVLHGKLAKQVLEKIFIDNEDTDTIIKKYQLQAATQEEIHTAIQTVLDNNTQVVVQLQQGDKKPMGFLMGCIMKETGGRADPQIVQTELLLQLEKLT